MEVLQTFHL